jgi:hypothetical protein
MYTMELARSLGLRATLFAKHATAKEAKVLPPAEIARAKELK